MTSACPCALGLMGNEEADRKMGLQAPLEEVGFKHQL